MKFFITSRITNFIAKIAGSKDAENITPKEPIEVYLNEIAEQRAEAPIVPKPTLEDSGKVVTAVDGEYELIAPTPVPAIPEPSVEDSGKVVTVVNGEYELIAPTPVPVIPEPTAGDNAKHLVVENGEYALRSTFHTVSRVTSTQLSESYATITGWLSRGDLVLLNNTNLVAYSRLRGTPPNFVRVVEFTGVIYNGATNAFSLFTLILHADNTLEEHNKDIT